MRNAAYYVYTNSKESLFGVFFVCMQEFKKKTPYNNQDSFLYLDSYILLGFYAILLHYGVLFLTYMSITFFIHNSFIRLISLYVHVLGVLTNLKLN